MSPAEFQADGTKADETPGRLLVEQALGHIQWIATARYRFQQITASKPDLMTPTVPDGYTKTDRRGAWSIAAGAAFWGLFWIPLRYLEQQGMTGLWAVALLMSMATLPAWLFLHRQSKHSPRFNRATCFVGGAMGFSTVLYFVGVVYSDVMRVVFLFYLLPLWTTLAARIIYGEAIRKPQLLVIATALTGLWLLLGGGTALPIPQNIGDWCGLGAGICWGVSLALLRGRSDNDPVATCLSSLLAGALIALTLAIAFRITGLDQTPLPPLQQAMPALLISLLVGCAILFPSLFGQIWGAQRVPAPTAALLTMTEILVATISTTLLIGTELSGLSLLGGGVIVAAVCIDLLIHRFSLR